MFCTNASEASTCDGYEEVGRRSTQPPEFSEWNEETGTFVVNQELKAEAQENARLVSLTPKQRMDEAVSKAREEIAAELRSAGVIDDSVANVLARRP